MTAGWLLWMTASTAGLVAVARGLDRLLAGVVDPAVRTLLYLPVFLRLALPVGWSSPIGLVPWGVAPVDPIAAAAWTWALGACALLVLWAARRRRLDRALRAGRIADAGLARTVGADVLVLVHPRLGPFVYGVLDPVLVLPEELAASPAEEPTRHAVAHELAHLRRHDLVLAAVLHGVCVLVWPVLPVWLASRRIHQLVEQAADADALRALPDPDPRRYGHTLLSLGPTPSTVPTGGFDMAAYSHLRERITALLRTPSWPRIASVPLTAALATTLLAVAGRVDASPPARDLVLEQGQSATLPLADGPPTSVTVADPSVVEVRPSGEGSLKLLTRDAGHTEIEIAWPDRVDVRVVDVVPVEPEKARSAAFLQLRRGEFERYPLPAGIEWIDVVDPRVAELTFSGGVGRIAGKAAGTTDIEAGPTGSTSVRLRVHVTE